MSIQMADATFSIWPNSAGDVILLGAGLAMGVLYSLDGWNIAKPVAALKDSPRVQNLKYALLGAGMAFIADLKQVGITTEKDRLLMFYAAGFFITAPAIILGVAALIGWQYRQLQRRYPSITFAGGHPALHYVYSGYHDYRAKLHETLEHAELAVTKARDQEAAVSEKVEELRDYQKFIHRFLPAYNKQISESIAAIDHYVANPQEPIRQQVARAILKSIQAVVIEYNDRKEGLVINVNYMRAYPYATAPAEVKRCVRFAKKDWSGYAWLLVLEEYAENDGREFFALPVPASDEKYLLPGAPEAFFNTSTSLIPQTSDIDFASGIDQPIKTEIKNYFSKKGFKSFASTSITHSNNRCGVVNIESNAEFVFGRDENMQKELLGLLKPLCLLLGFVLKT